MTKLESIREDEADTALYEAARFIADNNLCTCHIDDPAARDKIENIIIYRDTIMMSWAIDIYYKDEE